MKPQVFFDLTQKPDTRSDSWAQIGFFWRKIHCASSVLAIPFAVSFPGWMQQGFGLGSRLRVFFEDTQQADAVFERLAAMPMGGDDEGFESIVSRTRKATNPKGHEAFLMHRISSGISKRSSDIAFEDRLAMQKMARARRIAQQQHLPFVPMGSSSGNKFRLVIERIAADPSQTGAPNGYGLSRTSQIIALPVI